MTDAEQFEHHAAQAFFASAWADMVEENGASLRGEIMDQMPSVIDPAATHAAQCLRMGIERANDATVKGLLGWIAKYGNTGDRAPTMEFFGHYAAMQAMGHGVGLSDAFGSDAYSTIDVPYVEFGLHSLSDNYFLE